MATKHRVLQFYLLSQQPAIRANHSMTLSKSHGSKSPLEAAAAEVKNHVLVLILLQFR